VIRRALVLNRPPLARFPYHEWLANLNYKITLIAPASLRQAAAGLPTDVYDEVFLVDQYDESPEVERLALECGDRHDLACLLAPSEIDLVRAGRLRDQLGIPGQSEASATQFRDKHAMKSRLRSVGVPVPGFALLSEIVRTPTAWRDCGDTVLLKPRDGFGSTGIFKVASAEDFENCVRQIGPNNIEGYYVEEFVDGALFHVDGLILNGKMATGWPSRYLHKPLDYALGAPGGSFMMRNQPLTQELLAFTRSVIEGMDAPESASFHAEIFSTSEGQLLAGEIASRTAGNRIRDMVEAGLGIDLSREWVRAEAGHAPSGLPTTPDRYAGWAGIRKFAGEVVRMPSRPIGVGVVDFAFHATIGERLDDAENATDNIATVVCCLPTEEELQASLNMCVDELRRQLRSCISSPAS
jgi:hypothetical protein